MSKTPPLPARWLKTVVEIGIRAVQPKQALRSVKETLTTAGIALEAKKFYLLTLGKAADGHAEAWQDAGPEPLDYRVFGVRGYGSNRTVKRFSGNHPVPGPESFRAGLALGNWLAQLKPGLPIVIFVSGGASASVEHPRDGYSPAEIADAAEKLLHLGLDIATMNAVRCQWSALKAGQALLKLGKRPIVLVVHSDVPADLETWVSSGPFDPGPFQVSGNAREVFARLFPGKRWRDPGDEVAAFRQSDWNGLRILCGNNRLALEAAAHAVKRDGYTVELFPEALCEDAAVGGRQISATAQRSNADVLMFGGEPTVKLPSEAGYGRGGRMGRLALSYGLTNWDGPAHPLLAAATDGLDGSSTAAGAYWLPGPFDQKAAQRALDNFDSDAFFNPQKRLFKLPPTNVNVRDMVVVLKNTAKLKE